MKTKIKRIIAKILINYFKVNHEKKYTFYNKVYVKKGKIREWRTYDSNFNRIDLPIK